VSPGLTPEDGVPLPSSWEMEIDAMIDTVPYSPPYSPPRSPPYEPLYSLALACRAL